MRECNKPSALNNGKKCPGNDLEHQDWQSDNCSMTQSFVASLSGEPALIAGLAVVSILFISALAVGVIVLRKLRKNKSKVYNIYTIYTRVRPCRTAPRMQTNLKSIPRRADTDNFKNGNILYSSSAFYSIFLLFAFFVDFFLFDVYRTVLA